MSPRWSAAACSTGVGAVWRTAGVRPGERVAVFGCGGVGLSALAGSPGRGGVPGVAVDVSEDKLASAKDLGATETVMWQGDAEATAAAVRDATGGGVDYAIEATAGRRRCSRRSSPRAGVARPCGSAYHDPMRWFLCRRNRAPDGAPRPGQLLRIHPARTGLSPRSCGFTWRAGCRSTGSSSHRLPLEEAPAGLELVRTGRAVRACTGHEPEGGAVTSPERARRLGRSDRRSVVG
jgi:hypothetical protein